MNSSTSELVLREVGEGEQQASNTNGNTSSAETGNLFAEFFHNDGATTAYQPTPADEVDRCLRVVSASRLDTGIKYWAGTGGQDYPLLKRVALKALTVPATSAPAERVFSHGGIIMRPHRSSISPALRE